MTEMQSKTFKPGDLVRWIGEWPFPLVDAPPRENTVLAIETDGKVRLEGRHGNEALQRWWCPPSQLVHREPVQATTLEVVNDDASLKARFAALAVRLRDAADTYSESPPIFGLFFEAAEALDDAIKVDAMMLRMRSAILLFVSKASARSKFTSEWKANHRRWLDGDTLLVDAEEVLDTAGTMLEIADALDSTEPLQRLEKARPAHKSCNGSPTRNPSPGATTLRHTLAAQLRAAAKTASAWEEAAIREWEPLAPDYHDGGGAVTPEIEGPYVEHRLVMAWRGQVQRMADNLGVDLPGKAPSLKDNDPPGFTIQRDHLGWLWRLELHQPSTFRMSCQVSGWTEKDARRDAWDRYDSRRKLQAELDELRRTWATTPGIHYQDDEFRDTAWPFALMLSQDECTTVERWLADSTAEMPEVLRG